MRSLTEYRETLERIGNGTVSVEFAQEILAAWAEDTKQAAGEYTVTRAVEISGKSRGWFSRRLHTLENKGLARQLDNGSWLVKDAAIPRTRTLPSGGVDPSLSDDEIWQKIA